jgi:hypothetical protein
MSRYSLDISLVPIPSIKALVDIKRLEDAIEVEMDKDLLSETDIGEE